MTCFVIFLALLIERFFDWSHLRHWHWFFSWEHFVTTRAIANSTYTILIMMMLPPLIAVLLLQVMTANLLYGFARIVFELFILLYTFGPKNLWADAFFTNVISQTAKDTPSENHLANVNHSKSTQLTLLNNLFIAANVRLFAIVFWFVILGPVGAVFYRMVTLAQIPQQSKYDYAIQEKTRLIQSVLDWLPIRVFTILFALSGHFVRVFEMWRRYVAFGIANNETMLTACGIAALGLNHPGEMSDDDSVERHAESLIDRVFILLIILTVIGVFLC